MITMLSFWFLRFYRATLCWLGMPSSSVWTQHCQMRHLDNSCQLNSVGIDEGVHRGNELTCLVFTQNLDIASPPQSNLGRGRVVYTLHCTAPFPQKFKPVTLNV